MGILRRIKLACDPKLLKMLECIKKEDSYFAQSGWLNSYVSQSPVDNNNKPIPWVTYPFLDFITEHLKDDFEIFEFGSGNSTIFYANKVKSVVTIEHDKIWYDKMSSVLPPHVKLMFVELSNGGSYCKSAIESGLLYDVVIVDGRDRVNCIIQSVAALKSDGVMVLDDSERSDYREGMDFLQNNGFKRLDFWGLAPGLFYKKCTTIFFRDNNCLCL